MISRWCGIAFQKPDAYCSMDLLQFDIKLEPYPSQPEGKMQLGIEAWINGQEVTPWWNLPLDFDALRESIWNDGAYFIWTCSCGIPECAGLKQPIRVVHSTDRISWLGAPPPIAAFGELHFDKQEYAKAIHRALEQRDYRAGILRAQGEPFDIVAHTASDRGWYEGDVIETTPKFLNKSKPKGPAPKNRRK